MLNFRNCRRPFYRSTTFSLFIRSILLSVLFLCAASAYAAVYTWTGGAGDGSWSTAANWSPSGVPGSSDTIKFTAGQSAEITLNGDVTIAGALVYNTTGTVTFNLNGKTLNVGDSGTGIDSRFNLGSSTDAAALQGAHVVINGPGTVKVNEFDSSQNVDCSLTLNGGVNFSVSNTIYANGTAVTTIAGDSSCSFTLPAAYDSSDSTNVIEFAGAMPVTSAVGAYTVSTSGTPAVGGTVTVTVSSPATFSELKYVFTVKNTSGATAESYVIDGMPYTSGTTVDKTGLTPSDTSGSGSGPYVYTFPIVFPAIMDSGDGLSFTVQDGAGTALGSVLFFAPASGKTTTWTGTVNRDWSNSGNWTNGVPSSTVHTVTIPAVAVSPVLNEAVASGVKKITVDSGAELSLSGRSAGGAVLVNNGTVTLTGTETDIGSVTNGTVSTVVYTGPSATPVWGSDYANLTVNAGATLTLDRNVVVSGDLTNSSGAVFDLAGQNVTVTGALTNDGTVKLTGTQTVSAGSVTNGAGSTVVYTGADDATTAFGASFAALKTSAGKVLDFSASAVTAETIEAAGDLTLKAASLTLSAGGTAAGDVSFMCDDFELGGSFEVTSGNVTFDCPLTVASAASVSAPNGNVNFNSTIDDSTSNTNTFTVVAGGGTVTIGGNVGSTSPLAGFEVTAASVNVGAAAVFADKQTYTANVSVTTNAAATFTGSVTIGSGNTFTSGIGGITFKGSVTGGEVSGSAGAAITMDNAADAVFAPGSFTHNDCLFEVKGSGSLNIKGAYTFNTFTCVQAGKQIAFKAGAVQTVAGTFAVTGTTGSPVLLESDTSGTKWIINVNPKKTTVTYAKISDSESYDVLVPYVTNSTGSNTVNWVSAVYTWKGTADSNWDTLENWRVGTVLPQKPTEKPLSDNANCEIVIGDSGTAGTYPLVLSASNPAGNGSGVITLKSITVNASSRFETNGRSITADTVENNGSVTVSGKESFSFTALTNGAASTVTYRNAGESVFPVWAADGATNISYDNLVIQGSYTGGIDTTNTTLLVDSNVITVAGTLTNYGCIEINGTGSVSKTDSAHGKFIYSAAAGSIANYTDAAGAYDYYDLEVTAGTWAVSAPITAAGSVTNAAVLSLSAGGSVTAVKGVYSNATKVTGGTCAVSATGSTSFVMVAGFDLAAGSALKLSATDKVTTGLFSSSGTGTLELSAPNLTVGAEISVDTLILAPTNAATYKILTKISAANVLLRQGGTGAPSFVLDNPDNIVSQLAANDVGAVTLVTAGALSCGSVTDVTGTSYSGITASGNVTLNAHDAITQTAPLKCAELTVTSGAEITLGNTTNKIASLGAVSRGGAFMLVDSEGGLTVAGALGAVTSGASSVSITTAGGDLVLNGAITEIGTVTLNAGGAITQTALLSTNPLTAGTLRFQAGGDVTLTNADNAFGSVGGSGAAVSLADADGYTIDDVFTAGSGINANGAVSLSSTSGDITLMQPVASTGGKITFNRPVRLDADIEIDSRGPGSDGAITFENTVTNAMENELTLSAGTGEVTLKGAIGTGTVPLSKFNVTADSVALNGGYVYAQNQTYTADVTVTSAVQLTGTGELTLSTDKKFSAGTNLAVFDIKVTNDGKIIAGSGGISFLNSYNGASGTLTNDAAVGIEFKNTSGASLAVDVGTYKANGGLLKFSGDSAYNFKPGDSTYAALSFQNTARVTLTAGSTLNTDGEVTVGGAGVPASLMFENGAGFEQSWTGTAPSFTVTNGEVAVGTGTFVCGNLSVASGGMFTQTGANVSNIAGDSGFQSVQSMTNDGTLVWDSTSMGGFVTLKDSVGGSKAAEIAFNKKDVSVAADVTLSGVFYNLTVPAGVTVTNGAGIRVRRDFTIKAGGQYADNVQMLTLGGSDSLGADSEAGTISDNGTPKSSLGSVVVNQGTTTKSFSTDIKTGKISVSGGSGAVTFSGALEATQFENNGGTFALSFNAAAGGQSSSVAAGDLTINTTGAVSFGDDKADSFSVTVGALSVPAAMPPAAAGAVKTAGTISAASVTLNRPVSLLADTKITGSGTGTPAFQFGSTIDAAAPATAAALTVTAGTGTVAFSGAVGAVNAPTSLTIESASAVSLNGGEVHTSGAQTYRGAVTLGADTLIKTANDAVTANGAVTFDGASCTVNGAFALTVNSGTAALVFGGEIGTTTMPTLVSISAGAVELHAPLKTSGALTVSNSGIFKSLDGADIEADGKIELTGAAVGGSVGGAYQLAGSVVSSGGAVSIGGTVSSPVNVYLYTTSGGTAVLQFEAGAGNVVTINGNLFAAASGKTVVFASDVQVNGSFVTYGIPISFGGSSTGITCEGDIVLLGKNYAENDAAASGVTGLFAYDHPLRTAAAGYAPASLSRTDLFPERLPDGSSLSLLSDPAAPVLYAESVVFDAASLGGKTLCAKKNFYANGVALEGAGTWYLSIPDNGKKSAAFAEAYHTSFKNCTVLNNSGMGAAAHAVVAAAEDCTDSGSNTGIAFSRPYLLMDTGIAATDLSGTANRSGTYTVYDDVVRVEFRDSAGNAIRIENSENEISAALRNVKFNGGSVAFSDAFTDADCTASTDGAGDLAVFYLRISDADSRWNTDATGTSAGHPDSTDRGRMGVAAAHRTAVPNLDIPKALVAVYATLVDENKNRIAHYSGIPVKTDGSEGGIFGAVTDRCAPVLVAVRTGQELHELETATAGTPNQKPYDAHNFIEFCYSEPVDIGDLSAIGGALNVQASRSFASAAEHGGAITGTGGGLTVTGFASVASGTLVTGSRDPAVDVSEVHSLYRSFALTGADARAGTASEQPHRVRIGIASYVQGTVTRNNTVFHNWIGFIDESKLPAGAVTRIGNDFIVDTAAVKNKLVHEGTANHPLPALSVDSETDELYGEWDCSPPVFAKFASYDSTDGWANDSRECEIIGSGYLTGGSPGTTITQLEFHLFDNTPRYTAADVYQWVSKRGWMRGTADEQAARDISGGARSFVSQTGVTAENKTSGGIRASSLEGAVSAFSYRSNSSGLDSSVKTFENSGVGIDQKYYANSVFDAATSPTRSPDSDGLYFVIPLKPEDAALFPLRSSFDITYDASASYITDLAGNRMKSAEVASIDRSPPTFSLTVAPVKTDKLYIVFSKQIRTTAAALAVIPTQLELTYTSGTPVPATNFAIKDVPAELVRQTADGTGLAVTLSRPVTLDDVRNLRVRVKQPAATTIDPLTGLPDYIPEIFDVKGNSMIALSAHTLSDFAVNVVNVMYAFDGKGNADADSALLGEGTYGSVYDEYNWAVRDFSGSGNNTGRMLTDSDITVAVRVTDGTSDGGIENAPRDVAFKLIAAVTYPPDTVSDAYNNHLGTALRVWLPTELSTLASKPNLNVKEKDYVGEYAVDADTAGLLRNFVIPNASDSAGSFGWTAGQEVQFLFGLYDATDPAAAIMIDHDADPGTPDVPLYALCLSADRRGVQSSISGEMASSLDLWSFKLADKVRQRGGVTILNNVINASVREETVIEVDMPAAGNLSVQILTLDGNVVKTLQKGRTASGLHYYRWNGTNNSGSPVARGMYFVRITGSGFDETRKVMVVKE